MELEAQLTRRERRVLQSLSSPARIQHFIDKLKYRGEDDYISPLRVLRQREAHCFDGAVFAAAALQTLGYPPRLLYLVSDKDDHHMLALFKRDGCWGALSKSNFATLGLREPVYRTLRELVMSYFDFFFNINGYKGLRSYVGPLSLKQFDSLHWMIRDAALEAISDRLDWMREVKLVSRAQVRKLERAGKRVYRAGLIDADWRALYQP